MSGLEEKKDSGFEAEIKLAEQMFLKHGRANPLGTKFPAQVEVDSPDGRLKRAVEKLEQSKYKPPLHCKIKTLEDGQRVRYVVQAKPEQEGELKGFPISAKESLQIKLLHRTRAAIKLMEQKGVGPAKAAQLERLVSSWVTDWDERIKSLESYVDKLEKEIANLEKNNSSDDSLGEKQAELRKLQKQLLKSNTERFEECLEKLTVFTADACYEKEFNASDVAISSGADLCVSGSSLTAA